MRAAVQRLPHTDARAHEQMSRLSRPRHELAHEMIAGEARLERRITLVRCICDVEIGDRDQPDALGIQVAVQLLEVREFGPVDGERAVDVPAKLAARVRAFSQARNRRVFTRHRAMVRPRTAASASVSRRWRWPYWTASCDCPHRRMP